ncbi:MAG: UPF0262 family protein [Phreatobacter sp.]|uniref:UPF0262 family protein n=1 Tax=Phreatobacter sp. TaxID=1966341 RepID=UPI001A558FD9|nr:UPF0262 family protein [Phreatobacter sp.]MBL8570410.1 UPF0262 family protein [Phreatobacter sp.]
MNSAPKTGRRLVAVTIDEASIGRSSADIEHERAIAIYDLIEENSFCPVGFEDGPFTLAISLVDGKLMLDVKHEDGRQVITHILSLTPFRRIVKDYFLICDSYYDAIRTATPAQIETIDMARRGLHNEGSETLRERLKDKIDLDFDTARRLFTLISVLHWKG